MTNGERDADDPETRTVKLDPSGSQRRIGPYRLLRELGHGGMGTEGEPIHQGPGRPGQVVG